MDKLVGNRGAPTNERILPLESHFMLTRNGVKPEKGSNSLIFLPRAPQGKSCGLPYHLTRFQLRSCRSVGSLGFQKLEKSNTLTTHQGMCGSHVHVGCCSASLGTGLIESIVQRDTSSRPELHFLWPCPRDSMYECR